MFDRRLVLRVAAAALLAAVLLRRHRRLCARRQPAAAAIEPSRSSVEDCCSLPPELRAQRVHCYELARYPFPSLLAALLALAPDALLERLHETPDALRWLAGVKRLGSRPYAMRRNAFDKRIKAAAGRLGFRAAGSRLQRCYEAFVREVVAPVVDPEGAGLLYQAEPNVRIHLPGTGHLLVHRHTDADYHHNPNEVNFWVPLTPAYGTNSVFVESAPGLGDYEPFEMEPGEAVRFWGNRCAHYTLPNDTGATRVSFDFRVVPRRHWRERYPMSHRKDGTPRFGENAYFVSL